MFRCNVLKAVGIVGLASSAQAGCTSEPKPEKPRTPFDLNGKAWPDTCVDKDVGNFFGIGDWGGNVFGGGTWTNPGKCFGSAQQQMLELSDNHTAAYNEKLNSFIEATWPHPFHGPRRRYQPHHPPRRRTQPWRRPCLHQDHRAQEFVAKQMKDKANALGGVDFVLNAGDNFYPGGINTWCGQFGNNVPWDPSGQFVGVWQNVYLQGKLKDAPWISTLGNHDYGGMSHHAGWDVQIFFTWRHSQWIMPAQYFSHTIRYRDFSIKVFVMDSNNQDCCGSPHHKICQAGGDCFGFHDGNCAQKLGEAWQGSVSMLAKGLQESNSEWHFIVTHFPGPGIAGNPQIKNLHFQHGIDLIFTGHAHMQSIGESDGMTYIISGGGGGATTDASADSNAPGYGFVSFQITKTEMNLDMINWNGHNTYHKKVFPHRHRRVEWEHLEFV